MICSRCGAERLYQFAATSQTTPAPTEFPLVCRGCGLITIDGQEVNLPLKLELAAKSMIETQESAIMAGVLDLEKEPKQDIEGYMRGFYKAAYLEGFFRALAFIRHDVKEGRIRRLRALWEKVVIIYVDKNDRTTINLSKKAYNEFVQLLHLNSVPGKKDAKSNPHQRSAKQKTSSYVP